MAHRKPHLLFVLISLVALAVLAVPAAVGAANVAARPARKPTPTPTPTALPDKAPAGAFIGLTVAGAPLDAWTVVQWQDAQGAWHDVDGWRATLDDGYQQWWLGRNHYGTGPFRWCVLAGAEGDLLVASDPFSLPARSGEWVRLTLTVPAAG